MKKTPQKFWNMKVDFGFSFKAARLEKRLETIFFRKTLYWSDRY